MSEVKLIPLKQGAKFELRMFVQPSEETPTGKPIPFEKKLLSSPRSHGKKYLNKEVILGSVTKLAQMSTSSRILIKQVFEYNNSSDLQNLLTLSNDD
jgi:hypothetical protein